jgi:hypothetical protein
MRESYWWLLGTIVMIIIAAIVILFRDLYSSDVIVVEMIATLFGVLIAIALSEAFGANREESRARWVQNELVEELTDILELAQREGIDELHSPTWTAVKGTGIPDRIEPQIRRALADAFAVFDIYNYEVRKFKEHSFTTNPDDSRLIKLSQHIGETRSRLVSASKIVLDMVSS